MAAPPQTDGQDHISNEEFVRLLGLSQGRVFSFVITLLPDWTEAEELSRDERGALEETGRVSSGRRTLH